MAEIIKETVSSTRPDIPSETKSVKVQKQITYSPVQRTQNFIYFLFGLLEILLGFRLLLKLLGASTVSGFVSFIYQITGIFIMPFEGIFRRFFTQGVETTSVLEPATIVAMIVYAVLAWGIIRLIELTQSEADVTDVAE